MCGACSMVHFPASQSSAPLHSTDRDDKHDSWANGIQILTLTLNLTERAACPRLTQTRRQR